MFEERSQDFGMEGRCLDAAGEIDHVLGTSHAGCPPGKHSEGRLVQGSGAEILREARHEPVAESRRRFGCLIPGRRPRAARRDDPIGLSVASEGIIYRSFPIGDDFALDDSAWAARRYDPFNGWP